MTFGNAVAQKIFYLSQRYHWALIENYSKKIFDYIFKERIDTLNNKLDVLLSFYLGISINAECKEESEIDEDKISSGFDQSLEKKIIDLILGLSDFEFEQLEKIFYLSKYNIDLIENPMMCKIGDKEYQLIGSSQNKNIYIGDNIALEEVIINDVDEKFVLDYENNFIDKIISNSNLTNIIKVEEKKIYQERPFIIKLEYLIEYLPYEDKQLLLEKLAQFVQELHENGIYLNDNIELEHFGLGLDLKIKYLNFVDNIKKNLLVDKTTIINKIDQINPLIPLAEQPLAEQPSFEQPLAEQPLAEQPSFEQPSFEQPSFEQPLAEQPLAEQPLAEQPLAEQPSFEQPSFEQPSFEQPLAEQPLAEQIQNSSGSNNIYNPIFNFNHYPTTIQPILSMEPHKEDLLPVIQIDPSEKFELNLKQLLSLLNDKFIKIFFNELSNSFKSYDFSELNQKFSHLFFKEIENINQDFKEIKEKYHDINEELKNKSQWNKSIWSDKFIDFLDKDYSNISISQFMDLLKNENLSYPNGFTEYAYQLLREKDITRMDKKEKPKHRFEIFSMLTQKFFELRKYHLKLKNAYHNSFNNLDEMTAWDPSRPQEETPKPLDDIKLFQKMNEDWTILAAGIRGNSHKHDGKFYEDYTAFDVETLTNWNILVVSDGMGSAAFSRISSYLLVNEVKKSLITQLKEISSLIDIDALFEDKIKLNYMIKFMQKIMIEATQNGRNAVKMKAIDLIKAGHAKDIKDFQATLLICIHYPSTHHDFTMSFQIGDGAIAFVKQDKNEAALLSNPDHGAYAGQTIAIFSPDIDLKMREASRFKASISKLSAIALMTDGISDDFFPEDQRIKELFFGEDIQDMYTQTGQSQHGLFKEVVHDLNPLEKMKNWIRYEKKQSHDDRSILFMFKREK